MKKIKVISIIFLLVSIIINTNAQITVDGNGAVGIGTASPNTQLEVSGGTRLVGDTWVNAVNSGEKFTVTGTSELNGNTHLSASSKLFFGSEDKYLGIPSTTGDLSLISKDPDWMRFGCNSSIAFWAGNYSLAETSATPTGYQMCISSDGVGIGGGMAYGNWKLLVYGDAYVTGTFKNPSDKRYKKNIKPISNALDKVLKLNGKTYEFRTDEFKDMNFSKGERFGFIAQEIKEIIPEIVSSDSKGFYGVNYIDVIPMLVEAIKEQQIQIESQQNQIEELKTQLASSEMSTSVKSLDNLSTASLSQNVPNPFKEDTKIEYFLPENTENAFLYIYNMNGIQIKKMELQQKGKGHVTINGSELEAGMYLYSLIIDNKEISTKRMILTK